MPTTQTALGRQVKPDKASRVPTRLDPTNATWNPGQPAELGIWQPDQRQAIGMDWFTAPEQINHRRSEAPRAFYVDVLTHAPAAQRFGYTRWGMTKLVREYRGGNLDLIRPPPSTDPRPASRPGSRLAAAVYRTAPGRTTASATYRRSSSSMVRTA